MGTSDYSGSYNNDNGPSYRGSESTYNNGTRYMFPQAFHSRQGDITEEENMVLAN